MNQEPPTAANTSKIPDFLIRAAVAGRLHPVVVQYLALSADLAAMPEPELTAQLEPWHKLSQILMLEPVKSASLDHPTLAATLAALFGAERAAEFRGFARNLQRKVPDLETHLQLLARFRNFAEAAAKDRAERQSQDQPLPASREHSIRNPSPPLIEPPATQTAASDKKSLLPAQSIGNVATSRPAPLKLWPGHTYVVRRRSGAKAHSE